MSDSEALPMYFDYAATTPVDPRVIEPMFAHLTRDGVFGNPASTTHVYGRQAAEAVHQARTRVAALINARTEEIVWTSGATESNNLAIKGVAEFYGDRGRHIVTTAVEHSSVLAPCRWLQERGYEVTYVAPQDDGTVCPETVARAIRDDTILVSVMHANNETGVVMDISSMAQVCRKRGVLFHVDAAQSAGKIPLDVSTAGVDLLSLAGHKLYAPKGVGALYVRTDPPVRLVAQMHGGGHEGGLRSGTLATHQIVAMGKAFALAKDEMAAEGERLSRWRDRLAATLHSLGIGVIHGARAPRRLPGLLCVSFEGVEPSRLTALLATMAVSAGSACRATDAKPSHVLMAMGVPPARIATAVRFSFGRFTTEAEITLIEQHLKNLK